LLHGDDSVDILINGIKIERVRYVKFLGVYIDEYLRWDEHIQQITSKVAKNVGIVNKVKSLITSKLLLTLYNSLILPYEAFSARTTQLNICCSCLKVAQIVRLGELYRLVAGRGMK